MKSKTARRHSRQLGQRLLRRWFSLAALGTAVGGVLILTDDEQRARLTATARQLSRQLRRKLGEQWPEAFPSDELLLPQERPALGPGAGDKLPEA